jgi:hypothetical protein
MSDIEIHCINEYREEEEREKRVENEGVKL